MALTFKTPGVYVVEVQTPGPIEGVGTSTPAFVGKALAGDFRKPTKVTNWTQFINTFGIEKTILGQKQNDPYNASPRIYLAHAVRGFFDNGGTVCYVVRVGTGAKASLSLEDQAGSAPPTFALKVVAKQEGKIGENITVQVDPANIRSTKALQVPANTPITRSDPSRLKATVGDGKVFSVGDRVLLTEAAKTDTVSISKIEGNELTFETKLANDYGGGLIRIADLVVGQLTFRVEDTRDIGAGSIIHIRQGTSEEDIQVVGVAAGFEDPGKARPGFLTVQAPGLTKTYKMDQDVTVVTQEFTLTISGGIKVETFPNLSMEPTHSRYFFKVVADSALVTVELPEKPSPAAPPKNQPKVIAAGNLAGGANDDLTIKDPALFQKGIEALEPVDDVNIVCVPDSFDQGVQNAMIKHCEKMQDRFAILDPGPGLDTSADVGKGILWQVDFLSGSPRGFAALYYPRIFIPNPDPAVGGTIKVPPSGHIAGIYARSDTNRGVHKAPANESILGVLSLETVLTDADQGELNTHEKPVNVLRVFPGTAPIVWGARTISDQTAWRYVSTRRLFLFLEESIQEGTRFAVFEPNDLALWAKIKRVVSEFLTRVWRSGALFGATAQEAFYVKVDADLNPPNVRALGQVIIEIGVLVAFPAEFVIFRIGQKAGGAEVTELG